VIEQFTYLLYIKGLYDNEKKKESDTEFLGVPYNGISPKVYAKRLHH